MIDFHTHILPGIDDGSRSIEESLQLLKEETLQGVDTLIFSPHFYAHQMSFRQFLDNRERSYNRLMECLGERDVSDSTQRNDQGMVPEMLPGAEVLFFDRMSEVSRLEQLCIGDTRLFLLEMPFCQWTEKMYEVVRTLIEKRHLKVILAHVDRYLSLQKDRTIMEEILELPVTIQLNAGVFLSFGRRGKAIRMLKEHDNIILGSDTHNMETRKPNLLPAREMIQKKMGAGGLKKIDQYGESLLKQDE